MDIDTMLEYLGPQTTPELVHMQFDGMTETEILTILDDIFIQDHEDNIRLAATIYKFCNTI